MASKRYGYMCKYMNENGFEPIVLTTYARSGGFMDAKLDLPVPIDEKNVIRIGMMGVKYPVKNFAMNILFDWCKKNKKNSRVLVESSFGWFYKVRDTLDFAKLKDVDVVVGTFPPIENLLVAKYIAKVLKVPYVAEIRDLVSDYEEGMDRTRIDRMVELILERIVLGCSNGIVSVTKGFKGILDKRYKNKKIITVYNGWEFQENIKNTDNACGDYMYYAGSLYEHRVESLKLLLDILKESDIKMKLIVRSIGPKHLTEKLKNIIVEMGMESQVYVKDAVSEDIVHKEQENAKINLLVSSVHKEDKALMTTLPGKLFELVNIDRPVLAITDKSAEIGEVLKRTHKGIATSSKREIYDFLNGGYKKYKGNDYTSDYSRKNQARRLCRFLDLIVKESKDEARR
jgi:glycosyltransferase involved in cell wall biosynthesis